MRMCLDKWRHLHEAYFPASAGREMVWWRHHTIARSEGKTSCITKTTETLLPIAAGYGPLYPAFTRCSERAGFTIPRDGDSPLHRPWPPPHHGINQQTSTIAAALELIMLTANRVPSECLVQPTFTMIQKSRSVDSPHVPV
jgi:hypothetical protein